jgi:hypothetical protein
MSCAQCLNHIKCTVLTFLLFLRELGSVSVDDALLRGLRGASWAEAEAKLEREAQLFQRWRWAAVVRRRCRSSLMTTTGLSTQVKQDRKLWVKRGEYGSEVWRLAGTCPATPPQSVTPASRRLMHAFGIPWYLLAQTFNYRIFTLTQFKNS